MGKIKFMEVNYKLCHDTIIFHPASYLNEIREHYNMSKETFATAIAVRSEAFETKAFDTRNKASNTRSKVSETRSKASETRSKASETRSKASETRSKASETRSKASEKRDLCLQDWV